METSNEMQQPSPVQARVHLARNIARALNSTNNAITLYPPDSPMPREAAAGLVAALERFLMFEPYLQLRVGADSLCLEGEDICGESASLKRFAFQLHTRQVGQVRFMPGLDAEECVTFLRVLGVEPETLKSKGGLVKALDVKGLRHVAVVDLAQEAAADAAASGVLRSDATRVGGVAGLEKQQLVAPDPSGVCVWLQESAEDIATRGLPARESATELARVLSTGAGMAAGLEGTAGARATDNLAAAIMSLDQTSRRELLSVLLHSSEDGADALQAILSRIEETELAAAQAGEGARSGADPTRLLGGDGQDEARREETAGTARDMTDAVAVRRSMAPSLPRYCRRGDDLPFSATQLATEVRQFTKEERDDLVQAPYDANAQESMRSATTLLYLLNRTDEEPAIAETIQSLVSLADHALAAGQIGVLVRVVCGLRLKQERHDPVSAAAHRLDQALNSLSSPDVAAGVVGLLEGDGGSRLEAAIEYFLAAQPIAQEAAMEAFGGDGSQELKRRVQAIFDRLGPRAIGVTERHVLDTRWPVALYCVAILGRIGEPRVVPALRRALSHEEPRVVEQAIKSLQEIGGREAEEALMWAVEYGAGRVPMLAMRALGSLQSSVAVAPLRKRLEAGDILGRSLDDKLAAVEALGSIGTPAAIDALAEAQHRRFIFSPAKTKRLREAVARHLEMLTTE